MLAERRAGKNDQPASYRVVVFRLIYRGRDGLLRRPTDADDNVNSLRVRKLTSTTDCEQCMYALC